MMQPLGRKVLIEPVTPESDSPIVLVESGHEPDALGRIVAVGPEAGQAWQQKVQRLRQIVNTLTGQLQPDASPIDEGIRKMACDALDDTADLVCATDFEIGQLVIIPPDRGQEVHFDGVRYLILQDTDILATVTEDVEDVNPV
jgi:co-chaperonin GroES (HSP10)